MKPAEVIGICKGIVEPIIEKLTSTIGQLANKDDITALISTIETKFQIELDQRDKKIYELECRLSDIELQKLATTDKLIDFQNQLTLIQNSLNTQNSENSEIATEPENVKPDLDLLLVGDSVPKYVNTDSIRPGAATKNESKRGGSISDAYVKICEMNETYNVKELFLHTGSNHIPRQDPMSVAHELLEVIDRVQVMMPQTKIYMSAILPKVSISFNRGIDTINRHLCNVSKMNGFEFVEHGAFCSRGIVNTRLFAFDRIHPSVLGSKQLTNDFINAILKCDAV